MVTAYLSNSQTYVWALLIAVTVTSWWLSQGGDVGGRSDAAVTFSVILMAAIKSRFVMRHFMEVRHAPTWLRRTTDGWLIVLFVLLLVIYTTGL